jgi:hypothetical protein
MLANIGARTQHPGRRLQLVNQNGVVIFRLEKFTVSPVAMFSVSRCGAATWMMFSDDSAFCPTAINLVVRR